MTESCASCKWYREPHCKSGPPVRLPRKFHPSADSGNRIRDEELIWGWAVTLSTDWCGSYVAKVPQLFDEATLRECAKIARRIELRCLLEKISDGGVASFIEKAILELLPEGASRDVRS